MWLAALESAKMRQVDHEYLDWESSSVEGAQRKAVMRLKVTRRHSAEIWQIEFSFKDTL